MGLGFTALGLLPLPEATALGYAAPLLTVIFAAMFLGEEVRIFRLTAVFIGLGGVVIVLAPNLTVTSVDAASKLQVMGAMAALLGAVFAALAQVFVRKLIHTEPTSAIVFWFSVTASLLALVTLPFGWVVPTAREAALLVGAGLLGGVGQILLTESYRHAETGVIAPFEYVSMLLALVLGYALFGEVPTAAMLTGAALIVSAGLFIIWRERRLGLRRAERPQGDDAARLTAARPPPAIPPSPLALDTPAGGPGRAARRARARTALPGRARSPGTLADPVRRPPDPALPHLGDPRLVPADLLRVAVAARMVEMHQRRRVAHVPAPARRRSPAARRTPCRRRRT